MSVFTWSTWAFLSIIGACVGNVFDLSLLGALAGLLVAVIITRVAKTVADRPSFRSRLFK